MKIVSYFGVAVTRVVDNIAIRLRFLMKKAVALEFDDELMKEVNNGGIEKMLKEPSCTAEMSVRLRISI